MSTGSLLFIVILVVVFYFLLILPQRRQQKKKTEMMKQLSPGAKVMTASGIYAEIAEIHDDIIVARVAEGVEMEMDQRAVVRVISEGHGFPPEVEEDPEHPLGAPEYDDEEEFVDEYDEDAEYNDVDEDDEEHTAHHHASAEGEEDTHHTSK